MAMRFRFLFYFKKWFISRCYGIGFDNCIRFSLPDGSVGKNIIIFRVDMRSSVHIDNKGKDILILDKGSILRLQKYISSKQKILK